MPRRGSACTLAACAIPGAAGPEQRRSRSGCARGPRRAACAHAPEWSPDSTQAPAAALPPEKRSAGPCARPAAQVLTEENVRALRESVRTLTRTLEHVESISGDVGGLTGDGRVKANVRQLIEALSRITSD